jgi:isorenieratene synthase
MELVRRTETLSIADVLRIPTWPAFEMLAYDADRTYEGYDHVSAREYLDSLGFPEAARRMLFEVFAHSFFVPESDLSAGRLLEMFHFYFTGNPEGLVFDVWDKPFSTGLFEPVQRYLEGLGVRVATDTSAVSIARVNGILEVTTDKGSLPAADGLILATEVNAIRRLVQNSPALSIDEIQLPVQRLRPTSPFAVWRLWMDTPCAEGREPFVGTTGLGRLDNVSLYNLFQDEARDWAERHGGSVIELHAYAVPEGISESALRADLWSNLLTIYPEYRRAIVLDERFIMGQDCPGFGLGEYAERPGTQTALDDVMLAGDFVKLPFPCALMEAAVTSGFMAANQQLARWSVAGVPIQSVEAKGALADIAPAPNLTPRGPTLPELPSLRGKRFFLGRRPQKAVSPALSGPDWAQANPRRIERAWRHASDLPTGGWYVIDAASAISDTPKVYEIAGERLIVWRDRDGLHAAPEACPHMGASLKCASVERGEVVCPWHGLRLGPAGHGSWQHRAVYDDGVLAWVRDDSSGEQVTSKPILPERPSHYIDAVVRMEFDCEPEDIIRNRLDPWHGAPFHPYSFDALTVTDSSDERLVLRVSYRIAGPVVMEVDASFHCSDRRTIVMTILDGEGVGSVVETHATPLGNGRTAMIEATLATSERDGFWRASKAKRFIRPAMAALAKRLWADDGDYAERTAWLRNNGKKNNASKPRSLRTTGS